MDAARDLFRGLLRELLEHRRNALRSGTGSLVSGCAARRKLWAFLNFREFSRGTRLDLTTAANFRGPLTAVRESDALGRNDGGELGFLSAPHSE